MTRWAWLGLMAGALLLACEDSDKDDGSSKDAGPEDGASEHGPIKLARACQDELASIYAAASGPRGANGDVLRCAQDGTLSSSALQAKLEADGYSARAVNTGIRIYRVLYRTERGDEANTPATSSALVLLPDSPRSASLPVVVASHGSHGQCAACAPSKADPITSGVRPDFERQVYSLAGYGYAVIAPDLAGYADYAASGNALPSYASSVDAGKSTLDGARALRKLIPAALSDQVVLVGHSQGGHTALSALALSDAYGAEGKISAVALYAPLWLTQRSWGALLAFPGAFPFVGSEGSNAVAILYHYTRAELADGPGHGGDVFQASKRAQIEAFVTSAPWGGTGWDALHALGDTAADVFAPDYAAAIGPTAAGTSPSCPSEGDGKALCERWMARFAEDRPHLTGAAAEVPILLTWGGQDKTIGPDRVTCAIDRLEQDQVPLSVCVDPSTDHGGIVGTKPDYVADWIGARALDEDEPAACSDGADAIKDSSGNAATCNAIPPND